MNPKILKSISVFSYPKINLALDILGEDETAGFHEIQTVFHLVGGAAVKDEIIIERGSGGEITLTCDGGRAPKGKKNSAFVAAKLLNEYFAVPLGARIHIKKRIPMMAGLGGGSGNAAAVLKALVKLWDIKCCVCAEVGVLSENSCAQNSNRNRDAKKNHAPNCVLFKIAKKIGMDCAFFLQADDALALESPYNTSGFTAIGEHFGEKITSLPALPTALKFEIINTGIEISTRDAYEAIDLKRCGKDRARTKKMIECIRAGDAQGVFENLHNDFESVIFAKYPDLLAQKVLMEKNEPNTKVLLCGSGGCLVKVLRVDNC